MELTALEHSGWDFAAASGSLSPPTWMRSKGARSLTPVFRYGFESANRRMAVVCKVESARGLR